MIITSFRTDHEHAYYHPQAQVEYRIAIEGISRGDATLLANEIQDLIQKYKENNGL